MCRTEHVERMLYKFLLDLSVETVLPRPFKVDRYLGPNKKKVFGSIEKPQHVAGYRMFFDRQTKFITQMSVKPQNMIDALQDSARQPIGVRSSAPALITWLTYYCSRPVVPVMSHPGTHSKAS